jgi:hypothetical protein
LVRTQTWTLSQTTAKPKAQTVKHPPPPQANLDF